MPAVFFTNLALLGGLAALGIPILIHLLLKRKTQRLRFSTVQFFVKQDERANKRRKLRHWLLLAVRLLLVALLVLAFARPYWKGNQAAGDFRKRRVAVFVLDRSASMQATTGGQTQWNRALELIRKAFAEFKAEDHAAMVACSTQAETLSPLKPASAVERMLSDLAPDFGRGNLADGLRQAIKLLPAADSTTAPAIYVVSDLQGSECQELHTVPLPRDVELTVLNTGDLFAPNLAISEVRLEGQVQPAAHLKVKSFSDEYAGPIPVSLAVDGKELSRASVSLPAGTETNVILSIPKLKPGWHSAEARLGSKDAFSIDDVRHQAFFVPEPLRVLCVETKKGARIPDQDSFFVASALQPNMDLAHEIPELFAADVAVPDELGARLKSTSEAQRYSTIVLPPLRQIPAGLSEVLLTFVRNGGGLLMFIGDGVSANRYNAEFRDVLPAQLEKVETRSNAGWHIDDFDKSSPMFEAFQGGLAVNLRLPEFTRRFALSTATESSVLAKFDDGVPLIQGRNVGSGRVLLVNTTPDTSGSDWPKRKSFVPWLHGVVNYLADRSSKDTLQPSVSFQVGEDGEIVLGKPAKSQALILRGGGVKDEAITADDEGRLPRVSFARPGIYSVRDQSGTELRRWSVAVPAPESELSLLSAQDFQKRIVRSQESRTASLEANLFGTADAQRELWRVLLLGALILLFLEVLLANRTRA